MNNNIFQFNRFFKLLSRSLQQNPKSWMLSIVVFAGLPVIFLILNSVNIGINTDINDRITFFQLFINAAFVFSPFVLFYNYNHPKKGLTDIMLPASITEKFIVMQLACMLFAPLAVFALFGSMDSLFALIFPRTYGGYAVPAALSDFFSWKTFSENFVLLQAILFCNLLFVRRKIMKTAGVFIITSIVSLGISALILHIMDSRNLFDNAENISLNFGSRGLFEFHVNDHPLVITIQVARIFFQVVLPVMLMIGSYFVMKNKRY